MEFLWIVPTLLLIAAGAAAYARRTAIRDFWYSGQASPPDAASIAESVIRQVKSNPAGDFVLGALAADKYKVLDGDGSAQYFKTASGAGSSGDPYVPQSYVTGVVTADPTDRTLTATASTIAASGDNTVVSAGGSGKFLHIRDLVVQNETTTATTILVKDGATTRWRALLQNQGDPFILSFPPGDDWKLGDNAALVVNLSGANSHGYSVRYWTEG